MEKLVNDEKLNNNINETIDIRGITIRTDPHPLTKIDRMNDIFEANKPEGSLITEPFILKKSRIAAGYVTDIMSGKLDIEQYLPWKNKGNGGSIPLCKAIPLYNTNLYMKGIDWLDVVHTYQLRLVPETGVYILNKSVYTGNWVLVYDVFPMSNNYKFMLGGKKPMKAGFRHATPITEERLENLGIYLDAYGNEWLTITGTKMEMTEHVSDMDGNNRRLVRKTSHKSDTLYIRMSVYIIANVAKNRQFVNTVGNLLHMLSTLTNANSLTELLHPYPAPKLVEKIGTLHGLEDDIWRKPQFTVHYDTPERNIQIEQEYRLENSERRSGTCPTQSFFTM